jgi:hypothetical protein
MREADIALLDKWNKRALEIYGKSNEAIDKIPEKFVEKLKLLKASKGKPP